METLSKEVNKPRAIIQIIHGASEHINRYEDFANYLQSKDYNVYGINNSGHGEKMLNNTHHLNSTQEILAELKRENIKYQKLNLPIYVIGHSMGSILLRNLIIDEDYKVDKVILIGITNPPKFKLYAGKYFLKLLILIQGSRKVNKVVDRLLFKEFEVQMKRKYQTKNWLTTNEVVYQAYLKDKACSNPFTNQGAKVLLELTIKSVQLKAIQKLEQKDYLILIGANDPVSNFTKEIKVLEKKVIKKLNYKVYPKLRHEILNEINCNEVYEDIIKFLAK
ncbi:MAG: alpha/beta fold hydrolase [Mycoplasmatales bacterium]